MRISDWILVVYTFATFLLAGAAFWSIRQSYQFRNSEKRERFLNEIIEWAIDISKYWPKEIHKDLVATRDKIRIQELTASQIGMVKDKFAETRARNRYANCIAAKIGEHLERTVNALIANVEEQIEFLARWHTTLIEALARNELIDDPEYFKNIDDLEHELREHVDKVIEEAIETKTKGISGS